MYINKRQDSGAMYFYQRNRNGCELEETKISIRNKFTTITFEENVSRNSKLQTVKDYLMDVVNNEKEYNSSLHVTGIFSYKKEAPIKNWLQNGVEIWLGNTFNLPADWMQVVEVHTTKDCPLLFLQAMEKIEKDWIFQLQYFHSGNSQEFKSLLNKTMAKSAFYKFRPEEERN